MITLIHVLGEILVVMIYKTNKFPTELVPLGEVIRNFQTEKMRRMVYSIEFRKEI